KIDIPKRFILAGFDEFTPRQQDLLETLGNSGTQITHWAPRQPHRNTRYSDCVRVCLADEEKELGAAARWARALIERGAAGPIGIVIPALTGMRSAVLRVFDGILRPEAKYAIEELDTPHAPRAFNISLGEPLARVPLVRDAIAALTLANEHRHPISVFSQFLLSPYFAGAESDLMGHARLDVSLRAMGEPLLTLSTFLRYLESLSETDTHPDSETDTYLFQAGLLRGVSLLRELPKKQTLSNWAQTFADWLGCLGWPGERAPNSDEYQAVGAFHELLAEFAGLNLILGKCTFQIALSRLRQVAEKRIFQPRSDPAPIQILGAQEAAGLSFSHLWILGLHAESWPPPPRPNPFLPIKLQRHTGMPQASPDIALSKAQRATDRMLASADEIVVSYPRISGDLARTPSPLIAMLPEMDPAILLQSGLPDAWCVGAGMGDKEPLLDTQGPILESDDSLRGGTRIWQDQAACPFRAFATHRLGATNLDVPTVGLDYAMRGIMVHRALELIWRELRDSNRLAAMEDAALRSKISVAVDRTVFEAAKKRPETLRGRLQEIERARLAALVMEWLTFEKGRRPFTVIAPERGRLVSFGDLPVSIRPDRIDRVNQGTANEQDLLIDYKTGNAAMGDWFGKRPTNPQLPLYAVVEESDGIGFAFVRRGRMGIAGIAALPDLAPGIESMDKAGVKAAKEFDDWDGLLGTWRQTLVQLAESFAKGDAEVDPSSPTETCRYCDLHSLCRVVF
ncbi:MAG: PD-(D/E)XK nuclease family protein, partial [Gammaproteobacteria bacterium]|nr:PD-(D/E)XK nuclease family protein [Gammaproteobacteria bacterium]NNJ85068.1 hypothetical protein [Gammaproteobacteria bacterium]